MIRHKILDVWVKGNNPASQEVFRWFKYSIEKDYKSIEILSDIKTGKDETEYIKLCFLNANNYLNVLKYIKYNKDKFPYVYRGIESIY